MAINVKSKKNHLLFSLLIVAINVKNEKKKSHFFSLLTLAINVKTKKNKISFLNFKKEMG